MTTANQRRKPDPSRRAQVRVASAASATLTVLDNGLGIIVREDPSAPVVAVQAWCRTGSVHEGRWLGAGLSHVLEHMLFKGTERRTGPRLDQEVTEAGGYFNAYTSFDRTVYWINVPQSGATVAVDILCDVMQHATLPPEELARELDVIRREMDMSHDDPGQRASRRLFETAFTQHPCRHPIIGHRDLFNQLCAEDIRAYYRERYVPNNVFFVVVGDVRTEAILDQIRSAYQGTPARALPPLYLPTEPRQTSARRVIEEAPIALGHLHCSWHVPDLRHPDAPALDVLATLLGTGRSARLFQRVRERQRLVHSVDAWTYSPTRAGVFGISAVVDRDQHGQAVDALLREVELIRTKPVQPGELAKAKKQFIAATLATRKTMQGQAQDLGGSWIAADDLEFSERYLAAVARLTPRELLRVARCHLNEANRTHYALLPKGARAAVRPTPNAPVTSAPQLWTLPNGLRVLCKEDHRLPFVDFRVVFKGGVLREEPANNGITWLLTRTLLKGTRRRSAERIAREIESVGGHLDVYGGNNSFGAALEVLRPDFRLGLELLVDVLRHPQFPSSEVERERLIQLASIRAQRDQMLKSTAQLMRENLFGRRGYGLNTLGTETSVAALGRDAVRCAHARWVQPANAVLVVAGDVELEVVRPALDRAFADWPQGPVDPLPETLPGPRSTPIRQRVSESRDKRQAVVVVGFPGTTLLHPDRYALELLQEACSDLGSRLFRRIRDELGLAYYVGAQHFAGLVPGYLAFYAGTAPDHVVQVEHELLVEADQLVRDGLSAEELARAKAKIVGHRKIARQDLGHLALTMALDELYGLGYAHGEREDAEYEAVTVEQVREVAARHLQPDRAVVAILSGTAGGDPTAADLTDRAAAV